MRDAIGAPPDTFARRKGPATPLGALSFLGVESQNVRLTQPWCMEHAAPRSAKKPGFNSWLSDLDSPELSSFPLAQEGSNENRAKIKQKHEGVSLTIDPGFHNGLST